MSDSIYRDNAEVYATFAETSLPNALYDRPAMLGLAGNLNGRRVLELGCAAGGLTGHLIERGAEVLALDREPALVERARRRFGDQARFEVADLEEPLVMVPSASTDIVLASLVLHYLPDWEPLFLDLFRVLLPGGVLVFSIHHPITGWALSDHADYHRTELIHEQWNWDGTAVTAGMYRRPLSAVFGPLRDAGFLIDSVEEPLPKQATDGDERVRHVLATKPVFLFVRGIRGVD